MDAGRDGVIRTKRIARDMGCRTIGAGLNVKEASEPIYLEEAGGIGMFGVAYMAECIPATETEPGIFRWDDMDGIKRRIDEIKAKCRWCVVVSHGGEEFTALPSPYTRERYLQYLDMGADLVVCHHPHVPMNYELVGEKAIFYSLGNFIFDTPYQRSQYHTEEGVVLKLCFTPENYSFEACGIRILRGEERVVKGELPVIFRNTDIWKFPGAADMIQMAMCRDNRNRQITQGSDIFFQTAKSKTGIHQQCLLTANCEIRKDIARTADP
jgi:poly-gamma-glutamate synthesis protein (capsule biosynthesis protein)